MPNSPIRPPIARSICGALVVAGLLIGLSVPTSALLREEGEWPSGDADGVPVEVASTSPFGLSDAASGKAPEVAARVRYYPAAGTSARAPGPAVVLLHGAGGVSRSREGRYARAFAAQGVAVAVVDVFAARQGGSFVQRLINVTEAMALADAFAARDWLAARPEIDGDRVALIGFSYGGMSAIYAAYAQVVGAYGASPFAAHVAFYGPCIARFEDPTTTGAPVLMLWGERDAIMDPQACARLADDLRRGGSEVEVERYDAAHRWDGGGRQWRAPMHIADCRLTVSPDGVARDERTGFHMLGPALRATILALCANRDGYMIGADETVRRRSDAALARFLNPVLFAGDGS